MGKNTARASATAQPDSREAGAQGLGVGGLSRADQFRRRLALGVFGIGGSFLIVPGLFFATGIPILNAVATSLFSVGLFSTTTTITYAFAGLVNWLIALEYIGGIAGASLAIHLGSKKKVLTPLFAGVILVIAIYILAVNVTTIHLNVADERVRCFPTKC